MTGKFAQSTEVSVDKSRDEIRAVLRKYGADAFAYGEEGTWVQLMFRMAGKQYRFRLNLPDPKRADFHTYKQRSTTFRRAAGVPEKMWEQECRSLWRALLLVIRAKLEAVAVGISTLEDEFLANMVLPDNATVSDWLKPQIEEAYRIGHMPSRLLLDGPKS